MKNPFSHYLIRVIDDDEALLKAMKLSLELDGWQTAVYKDAETFLESDNNEMPGCLILDYLMPGATGIELQRLLVEQGVLLPTIFLTAHAEVPVVIKAFQQGAVDFLLKPVDPELLTATIIKAVEREEEIIEQQRANSPLNLYSQLTEHQKKVASLVAQGLTCSIIGERLGKSRRTIERHRGNVLRILRVSTPKELSNLLMQIKNSS